MATSSNVETERKFDASASTPLPDFRRIAGVARVGEPMVHHLEAVYFDTEQLSLAAHKITLRRRTGGTDAGWHLKLPHGAGSRTEVHAALGSVDVVPDELLERVLAYTRGRALAPVATLHTERTSYALYAADGTRTAEFVDDQVTAHVAVGQPREDAWREWEVELADAHSADHGLMETLAGQFVAAGAVASKRSSKLATALGDALPKTKKPQRSAVIAYLETQLAEWMVQDAHVRQDRDDSVHQLRSVIRRIRSVLHSYRTLFEESQAVALESELKSLAETLGRYRDNEVLHHRLRTSLEVLPAELLRGSPLEHLDQRMQLRADVARAAIGERITSPRYYRLLENLEALIDSTPLKGKGAGRKATAKLVNKAAKRLAARHEAAVRAAVGPDRDHAFHEVRKAAKKLRFAAAAVDGVHGKRATAMVKAAHKVQSILGEHQDSAMAREELLRLGSGAGEAGFTYGVLYAQERQAADSAQQEYLKKCAKARKLRLKN
ncbi:CYTH and CHAD domain-containing protein [Paenarthrobacter ilicis]|uniref:CYTH and CHAD domain-containing protein n=1 Tax=Paenarthrobacter ilicis TaxID=43665 RepID=UPI0028D77E5E|nr:CYTH and CHAD domain-containing protein [Paenarthrobacter ilicis]